MNQTYLFGRSSLKAPYKELVPHSVHSHVPNMYLRFLSFTDADNNNNKKERKKERETQLRALTESEGENVYQIVVRCSVSVGILTNSEKPSNTYATKPNSDTRKECPDIR